MSAVTGRWDQRGGCPPVPVFVPVLVSVLVPVLVPVFPTYGGGDGRARPGPGQPKITQEAAGASMEPVRDGMPVAGSMSNQVTSPECSLAA